MTQDDQAYKPLVAHLRMVENLLRGFIALVTPGGRCRGARGDQDNRPRRSYPFAFVSGMGDRACAKSGPPVAERERDGVERTYTDKFVVFTGPE